jgi:hypothetical protein
LPRVIRTIAALAVAFACVAAPTAVALPGDPPVASTAPADGATTSVDPDGIPVSSTCPAYRISDAGGGFILYGGPKDYGVSFSESAALGADGRLADPVALGRATETPPTGSARPRSAPPPCAGSGSRPTAASWPPRRPTGTRASSSAADCTAAA